MPTVTAILECLCWLTVAAYLVLYLRLRRQGLDRVYRVFANYLLFRAARASLLAALPPIWYALEGRPHKPFSNNVYGWSWTLTEPVLWVLHVLVVLELYSLVLKDYEGVASMGRWVVLAGLSIAIVLSSLTLPAELSHSAEHSPILRVLGVSLRAVDTSLVIFLLFIAAFLVWFPIPLSRNAVLYSNVLGRSVWSAMVRPCASVSCASGHGVRPSARRPWSGSWQPSTPGSCDRRRGNRPYSAHPSAPFPSTVWTDLPVGVR